jgi:hypothetical protein
MANKRISKKKRQKTKGPATPERTPANIYINRVDSGTTGAVTMYSDSEAWQATTWETRVSDSVVPMAWTKKKGKDAIATFKVIKKNLGIIEARALDRRIKALERLINEATSTGQLSIGEKAVKQIEVHTKESRMFAAGFRVFIEIEQIKEFVRKSSDRDLFFTELENFQRLIPAKPKKRLKKAVDSGIFESFIVLHYDPDLTGVSDEQKEKTVAKRKDPILFGIIPHSTRYYFIADWIDEYCDLTFDDVISNLEIDEDDITLKKDPVWDYRTGIEGKDDE